MITLRCIAVDDEPPALALLREYIRKFAALQLVHTFDDAISAGEFLRGNTVDLVFMDINMPDINGIDLVRSLELKPMIIFTTAYKKFAVEGFELDAIDYLVKPIAADRFAKAVNKALEYHRYRHLDMGDSPEFLFVYAEYRMVKIDLRNVEYIESLEDYIKIHVTGARPILTLMTLKGVLEKLPESRFRRIHRSYIVATDKVRSVLNRKARLESGIELPISDSYAAFVQEWKSR